MQKPTNSYYVTSFYRFTPLPLETLKSLQSEWLLIAENLNLKGLLIISTEGINATVCAPTFDEVEMFKTKIAQAFNMEKSDFKNSVSDICPFRIMKVAIRNEACTFENPGYNPSADQPQYLTPKEWHEWLKREDVVCIDTRNWYETRMGMFEGALDLKIDEFTEFPEAFRQQNIPKDKDVMIYCTGGIRCEKALAALREQGYQKVYQLKNGILSYLEEFPEQSFKGECFVFDERVAVDQHLKPTQRYKFCPHCGQPAEIEQCCKRCDSGFKICADCEKIATVNELCSKDCAYQFGRFPGVKAPKQNQGYKVQKTLEAQQIRQQ